jgi:hypothetical protein
MAWSCFRAMSGDKPNPVNDLKQGLGLLFRAAKGAVEQLPTGKVENVVKDAAMELERAFENLGTELEKVVGRVTSPTGSSPPAEAASESPVAPAEQASHPSSETPEPPNGPRVA